MTVKELIGYLSVYPDNMEVNICIDTCVVKPCCMGTVTDMDTNITYLTIEGHSKNGRYSMA